jgi:hypothetical protein
MTYFTSLIERLSKSIGIGASRASPPTADATDAPAEQPVVPPPTPETTDASTNGSS